MMANECTHGQLARSCDLCEKDKRIASLEAANEKLACDKQALMEQRDELLANSAAMLSELFNRMTVEQLKAVPSAIAERIGEFMLRQGYRLVFDRWYKQFPAIAIANAEGKTMIFEPRGKWKE